MERTEQSKSRSNRPVWQPCRELHCKRAEVVRCADNREPREVALGQCERFVTVGAGGAPLERRLAHWVVPAQVKSLVVGWRAARSRIYSIARVKASCDVVGPLQPHPFEEVKLRNEPECGGMPKMALVNPAAPKKQQQSITDGYEGQCCLSLAMRLLPKYDVITCHVMRCGAL